MAMAVPGPSERHGRPERIAAAHKGTTLGLSTRAQIFESCGDHQVLGALHMG
jgi:hypothetical protein